MNKVKKKITNRIKRHKKIRTRVFGTKDIPRLSLYKSNKYIYAQIIDDNEGNTLVSVSVDSKEEKAKSAGEEIAKKAIEKNIKKVVFDRGGFVYTGKIKAFADGARAGGLKF